MPSLFLTAEWKKLLMANYPVEASALRPLVPARTELDTWNGDAYVSLVGFQFRDVRVRRSGSQEEFITEHFWGYAGNANRTGEYQVAHPRWDIYKIERHTVDCDFGGLYGAAFADLRARAPQSVFLAEGSEVEVYSKRTL